MIHFVSSGSQLNLVFHPHSNSLSISPACFHLHESFTIILYLHSAYFRSVMTVNVFPPSPFLALVNHLLGHYKFFTFRSRSDAENTTSSFIFLDIGGRVGHTCSVGPCEPLQVHLLLAIVGQTTFFLTGIGQMDFS